MLCILTLLLHLPFLYNLPLSLCPVFEGLAISSYELQVSRTEAWKKGVVCFAVFNCTTKGGEKHYLYRGRIVAVQGDQVDVRWEAERRVKAHSGFDVHASKLAASVVAMKKDSTRSPIKDAPQPASNKEVFDNTSLPHLSKLRGSSFQILLAMVVG